MEETQKLINKGYGIRRVYRALRKSNKRHGADILINTIMECKHSYNRRSLRDMLPIINKVEDDVLSIRYYDHYFNVTMQE